MADKTLKTRIKLRYDTLANWTNADPVLLAGEIAVVQIATKNITNQQMPPIMFKVGDGEKKFSELGWTSGLAADVYDWAKAANKPSYDYSEISGTPTIPTVGNGKITITQNSKEVGSFTVNQSGATTIALTDTADTDTQYQLVLSGHTLKLQSKAKGGAWADVSGQSFTLPDNNTTYTFAEGTTNGAFTVTPSGSTAQSIKVHGLGTAAYKAESDFDANGAAAGVLGISSDAASANTVYGAKKAASTAQKTADDHIADKANPHGVTKSQVGLGSVVNAGRDTAVTADSNNYITSGAVKTYVDNAIGAVKQFQYEVITGDLPTASAGTMGKIYLKAHAHGTSDSYDEWITIETESTTKSYSWEKIGNTDIDLTNYVNILTGTASNGVVTNITKNNGTLTVTSVSLAGTKTATSGKYISGITQDKTGKITSITEGALPVDTNTAHTHTNGVGLVRTGNGGTSGAVDYKVALKSETANANSALAVPAANANRFYPVEVDKDGKLAVTVPWSDTDTHQSIKTLDTTATTAQTTAASEAITGSGKITLHKVSKTGNYNDLLNKPTIPSVGNAALKGTDGTTIFTANATEDVTITIIDCGGAE